MKVNEDLLTSEERKAFRAAKATVANVQGLWLASAIVTAVAWVVVGVVFYRTDQADPPLHTPGAWVYLVGPPIFVLPFVSFPFLLCAVWYVCRQQVKTWIKDIGYDEAARQRAQKERQEAADKLRARSSSGASDSGSEWKSTRQMQHEWYGDHSELVSCVGSSL